MHLFKRKDRGEREKQNDANFELIISELKK